MFLSIVYAFMYEILTGKKNSVKVIEMKEESALSFRNRQSLMAHLESASFILVSKSLYKFYFF